MVFSMPRSGSSWLGQIFDSCPYVLYKFQPFGLENYAQSLENIEFINSPKNILESIFNDSEPFINQRCMAEYYKKNKNNYMGFLKNNKTTINVCKNVHGIDYVPYFINIEEVRIIFLIRHPCGYINSLLTSPERSQKDYKDWIEGTFISYDNKVNWFTGAPRYDREYRGFLDWIHTTLLFTHLESNNHDKIRVLKYEDLVESPVDTISSLFKWLGIKLEKQTIDFIETSTSSHDEDPYSVYKNSTVVSKWKYQLDMNIQKTISYFLESCGIGLYQ